jgi:hypothetical protein
MPCAEFEELLEGYHSLTAADRQLAGTHLSQCATCREHLETLLELEQELVGLYTGIHPRAPFDTSMIVRAAASRPRLEPLRPPSAWPEVLDFCGWAAVTAIAAVLVVTLAAQAGIPLTFTLR